MKRHTLIAVILMCFSATFFIYTMSTDLRATSELLFESDVNALAFSNEGPGPQGSRQTQAVWCGVGGWNISVGCCYGMDNCSIIDCSSRKFSCDGNTWISF